MKNIILCADGTGNLGGETPDSNVFKMYNAVDIHNQDLKQVTFYDNGVGTADNKYWRGLSGAFGFGFKRNVCDLYRFLATHYKPGDQVFLFGFSRGAAEVRAFTGFLAAAGLIDGHGCTEDELRERTKQAFKIYESGNGNGSFGEHGAIPIKFVGVWDTVSALGFPQDWKITGIGMWVLNVLFMMLDHIFDFFLPHRFYNFELTPNIEFAYQALAIDDERNSFTPKVWDERIVEKRTRDENRQEHGTEVEQVWFAGAHSNVGGGYGRAGLANVALDWMMIRAKKHGMVLKDDVHEEVVHNSNVHGRLYDSRDGFAVYYRYVPRDIQELCKNKLRGNIAIHDSVLDRMKQRTANYAPGNLPVSFDVVGKEPVRNVNNAGASVERKAIKKWVFRREWLYGLFLEFTLIVVGAAICLWIKSPGKVKISPREGPLGIFDTVLGHIAEVLTYILPRMFESLVNLAVIQKPIYFGVAMAILVSFWGSKRFFRHKNVQSCELARETLLKSL